jgi:hypothetical protein
MLPKAQKDLLVVLIKQEKGKVTLDKLLNLLYNDITARYPNLQTEIEVYKNIGKQEFIEQLRKEV